MSTSTCCAPPGLYFTMLVNNSSRARSRVCRRARFTPCRAKNALVNATSAGSESKVRANDSCAAASRFTSTIVMSSSCGAPSANSPTVVSRRDASAGHRQAAVFGDGLLDPRLAELLARGIAVFEDAVGKERQHVARREVEGGGRPQRFERHRGKREARRVGSRAGAGLRAEVEDRRLAAAVEANAVAHGIEQPDERRDEAVVGHGFGELVVESRETRSRDPRPGGTPSAASPASASPPGPARCRDRSRRRERPARPGR